MTLAIPEQLYSVMKRHPEIKWTEIMRIALRQKTAQIEKQRDPLREYALKHAAEDWTAADELFEF